VDKKDVHAGHNVLPSVWAMLSKRNIATIIVYNWKARLNIHSGKQEKGANYWDTYAPVASWSSIRIILSIAVLGQWKTKHLDFILALPQAPIEPNLCMAIPEGFSISGGSTKKVLKLKNNLYSIKQAGRVWNLFLTEGLISMGFQQSQHDPCIYRRENVIISIYTDKTIVTGPDEVLTDKSIKNIGTKFEITTKDSVDDFLVVKIIRDAVSRTFELV
jgi:hypothetical protein